MRKTTEKRGFGWIIISGLLLVLCLVLTGRELAGHRLEQARENLYMRTIYYDLRDIAAQAQDVSQMDSFEGEQLQEVYHLQLLLKQTDDDISKDAGYLTGTNPSAFGIWFSQQASRLHTLCEAEPIPAEQIRQFAKALQTDAESLYRPFTGEDGLNFDDAIRIEAFTAAISDVHNRLTP